MSAEKDREPVSAMFSQAPMPAGAVFLSYASEDAAAAERIATALRNDCAEVDLPPSVMPGRTTQTVGNFDAHWARTRPVGR